MRVAFTLIGGTNWTGGYNYLLNLLRVLSMHQADRIRPLLFLDSQISAAEVSPFVSIPGVEVIRSPAANQHRKARALMAALVWGVDGTMRAELLAHRVDVVFEAAQFFGWRLGLPVLAWIPDFQHRALRPLFTYIGFLKRELGFRAQVMAGRTIMLSSENARAACELYYPSTKGRTATVRFAVPAAQGYSVASARTIADLYDLPDRFFFLPNQFWQHKNHLLVLDALSMLKSRGVPVVVVASGKQFDPRRPGYIRRILAIVRDRDLGEQFRLLGIVPHEHVSALMLSGMALLNPSRFEGWSTTVEEARSLGTPLLLSDIAVHREQAGADATYFDANDAGMLAKVLRDFVPLDPSARGIARVAGEQKAEQRVQRFSEEFVNVVQRCVAGGSVAQ